MKKKKELTVLEDCLFEYSIFSLTVLVLLVLLKYLAASHWVKNKSNKDRDNTP